MFKKICLWSTPRNFSTALMYSFGQRKDMQVFDEPLYAHYLLKTGIMHPGRKTVLANMENNGSLVISKIILKNRQHHAFHKLMSHFLIDLNLDFLKYVTNILLIRNPFEVIASYSKVVKNPNIDMIGIKKQYELCNYMRLNKIDFVLLDSALLTENPAKILKKICDLIGLSYCDSMLSWEKGPKRYDGVWSKYWYNSLHDTTGFIRKDKDTVLKLNKKNTILAEKCMFYYDSLLKYSIN